MDIVPPRLTEPVVLVHGVAGFSRLFGRRKPAREYFPGVRAYLESAGNRVLMPRLSPTARIAVRARELQNFLLREVGQQPVHIIGHSMGGLDARYMISRLGMANRVRSLTTIGSPHRGTTFADWALDRFGWCARPLLRAMGVTDDAFQDLTTTACKQFNEETPDMPGVRYFSVAGQCERPLLTNSWRLSAGMVSRAEGPNDGIVSVQSATWGEATDIWLGDHLNLVNWPNRQLCKQGLWQDRAQAYGRLLQRAC